MVQNKKGQLQGADYVTPVVKALDIQGEGLLCASGNFAINDWEFDTADDSLNF